MMIEITYEKIAKLCLLASGCALLFGCGVSDPARNVSDPVGNVSDPAREVSDPVDKVSSLESEGRFAEAAKYIDEYLETEASGMSPEAIEELKFEKERLDRIRKDFTLTKEEIVEALKKEITGFSEKELESWDASGFLDNRVIDGAKRYFDSAVANLFFRHPEIRKRRIDKKAATDKYVRRFEQMKRVKEEAAAGAGPLVWPQRLEVEMTLAVEDGAAPAGKTVRCWMPYPSVFQSQYDVEMVSSDPPASWVSHPESEIRSVYLEKTAESGKPTEFRIKYRYTSWGMYQKVDPEKVLPYVGGSDIFERYTRPDPPHVEFTEELTRLAEKIVGDETNPYLKAKRIYDWVAGNVTYSLVQQYSTIRNISMFIYENRYGDCGVQSFLFITLCRISGVAARWQSGWSADPGAANMHDWAEIYIEPYGWLPVDVTRAGSARRNADSLGDEQKDELSDFYLGGIDPYRMVANKGHNLKLYPPKRAFRSETVDFQHPEVEYDEVNIYQDEFSYRFEVRLASDDQ